MFDTLLDVSTILFQFIKEGIPQHYLYSLAGLPFLLLISELVIRKVLDQPFMTKKEIFQTFGYLVIGVVIFITALLLVTEFVKSITIFNIHWQTEDAFLVGLVTLLLFALLSPITILFIYIKSKYIQIIYLIGNSIFFCYLIGWVATYFEDHLKIPINMYVSLGIFYILFVTQITNAKKHERVICKKTDICHGKNIY